MSTQSQRFNANDADVVIRSSDNVDFRLHKKNLEFATGGFPPTTTSSDSGEVVKLDETAATLDIMFQFVYPKRYSLLEDVEFEDFMLLAEAAEKYEVFALILACESYMRRFLLKEPYALRLLKFATMHDYRGIVEELALVLVDKPMNEVVDKLIGYSIFKSWSLYRDDRMRLLHEAIHPPRYTSSQSNCGDIWGIVHKIQEQFKKPSDLSAANVEAIFVKERWSLKTCCNQELSLWRSHIQKTMAKIKPFSFFVQ
ncbi:hypothetical protein C8R42DRAFT_434447 [Lentinula raphanica]|nr:hypothetical protein C8R42DRAFT_434447 [Lentinula raphanica]